MRRPVAGSADRAAGTQRAGQTLEIPERWSLPKRSGASLGGRLADSHYVVRDPPSSVPIGEPGRIGPRRHGHGADARCVRQVDAVCSASADTFRHDTGPGSYGTLRRQTDPRLSRAPRGEQRRSRWLASALPRDRFDPRARTPSLRRAVTASCNGRRCHFGPTRLPPNRSPSDSPARTSSRRFRSAHGASVSWSAGNV